MSVKLHLSYLTNEMQDLRETSPVCPVCPGGAGQRQRSSERHGEQEHQNQQRPQLCGVPVAGCSGTNMFVTAVIELLPEKHDDVNKPVLAGLAPEIARLDLSLLRIRL